MHGYCDETGFASCDAKAMSDLYLIMIFTALTSATAVDWWRRRVFPHKIDYRVATDQSSKTMS